MTYAPMVCEDCTGTSSPTSLIVVDGNGNGDSADAHCSGIDAPCNIVPVPKPSNIVRAYSCDGEDSSVRPSLKLLGLFDPNTCPESETLTYNPSMCGDPFVRK